MKKVISGIKYWVIPAVNRETAREIDKINIHNIYYLSLIIGVVQAVSLMIYCAANYKRLTEFDYMVPVITVGGSVLMCLAAYFVAGAIRRSENFFEKHHSTVNVFAGIYFGFLVGWAMFASARHFVRGEQIVTFYTVQLGVVLFVKLQPLFTSGMILTSYTAFYIWLNLLSPGKINGYNFMMLALISAGGTLINYRLTVSHIEQKIRAEELNESLEVIANHDSITGLQNRYALNKQIESYKNHDLCVAMGDINRFKQVNDTYGHHAGDVVLKRFAEILRRHFSEDAVFRYGGDEFLIVEHSEDYAAFRSKVEEVNREFSAIREYGMNMEFGCSFGSVSDRPATTADFFDMILTADQKLYDEKRRLKSK